MDESMVPVAQLSARKQIVFLYQNIINCPRKVLDVFENAKICLELLQAYMQDSEDKTDESSIWMDRRACIDIANDIQDILDRFMYKLLYHLLGLPVFPEIDPVSAITRSQNSHNRFRKFFFTDELRFPLRFIEGAHRQVAEHMKEAISLSKGKWEVRREEEQPIQETTEQGVDSYDTLNLTEEDEAVDSKNVNKKPIKRPKKEAIDPLLTGMSIILKSIIGNLTQLSKDFIEKSEDKFNQQLTDRYKKRKEKLNQELKEEDPKDGLSHLPSHLKSCFLYVSKFPKGHSVRRERLLRLWVAEGFVSPERGITVDQVAEGYLDELVARNLILVTSRKEHGGRVKRCQANLQLVPEIYKSREKNIFATVVNENHSPAGEKSIIHRLFLVKYPNVIKDLTWDMAGAFIRSFLVFEPNADHGLRTIFGTNKFLKVLDLEGTALERFPESILRLYLLKYLSLRNTKIRTVPRSIRNLLFLETLDLKNTLVCQLPRQIGKLQRLRHLLLFESTKGVSGGVAISSRAIRALSFIEKLSFVKASTNRRVKGLGELRGIRKLGLTDLSEKDGEELCASLEKMQKLSTLAIESTRAEEYLVLDTLNPSVGPIYLQHLYLKGRFKSNAPKWISELTSLTKLSLKGSKLRHQAKPLAEIQALPNLMELELVNYYSGDELIFEAETFLKLVKLDISQSEYLTSMKVKQGALPSLQTLALNCQYLKNIPIGIENQTCLRELLLYDMPDEFTSKLRKYGKGRHLVEHIGVIRSYFGESLDNFEDLSPSFPEASTSKSGEETCSKALTKTTKEGSTKGTWMRQHVLPKCYGCT